MEKVVKIILAEDDENHALLIRRNLARIGVDNHVLHFGNGEEVLRFFLSQVEVPQKDFCRCILILDLKMPRVDGMEVLETLKSHPVLKKVPVVVFSTTDNKNEIEECYRLGCSGYIVKPISYEQFTDVVSRLGLFLKSVTVPENTC